MKKKIVKYGFCLVCFVIVLWGFISFVQLIQPAALEYQQKTCGRE